MMDSPYVDINNKSFIECWTYIREQTSLLRMPAECAGCPDARFCRACAAMCYCETGSTDKKPEYVCGMIRSIRENTDLFLKKLMKIINIQYLVIKKVIVGKFLQN